MGPVIMVLLFVGIGGLLVWLGWSEVVANRQKKATWLRVQGEITGFEQRRGSKGLVLHAPVYRYWAGGQEHVATSQIASSNPGCGVGDTIELLVNPAKPGESTPLGAHMALFSWGMLLMGGFCAALGLLVGWLAFTGALK